MCMARSEGQWQVSRSSVSGNFALTPWHDAIRRLLLCQYPTRRKQLWIEWVSQLNTQHKTTPVTLTHSLCARTKTLFETQHLLKILFLFPATSNSLSVLSARGHDIIKITVDSCVIFVWEFVFRVVGTNIGVSGCDVLYYVLLYQFMHLLQVTLKLLKTPLLKNNPTRFDLSRSSSGIHFLVELLLFSL